MGPNKPQYNNTAC